jgi:hypothetical protein
MAPIAKEIIEGVRFDWAVMQWRGLTVEYLMWLEQSFPDINVKTVLDGLTEWLHNNRNQKRAHKSDWHKFLTKNMRKKQIEAVL